MLTVNNLCVCYNQEKEVIHQLTMSFEQSNAIGILGANGSGKSTLFQTIVGLLKPSKGQVCYQNQPLHYGKKELLHFRQEVGIVFQEPDQQIFYSVVEDDVAFALKNLGLPQTEITKRLNQAFGLLGINDLRKRPIQYLSYGQKKRVAIASVLVLQTKWLLLDEPTAGLDPAGRKQMIAIIQRLIAEGRHVILSSHDMDLMYDVCSYYFVLQEGRLILEGDRQIFLEKELLLSAHLEQPWLVKMHQQLGTPLYENEAAFYSAGLGGKTNG